jgi:YtfJ family uncharacterized protein
MMAISQVISGFVLTLVCAHVFAAGPTVDAPLPPLSIGERGELTLASGDADFVPWNSEAGLGKVQVIQYFGATMKDSEIFKPFTDLLDSTFEDGTIRVITVLNLDAAMWGTTPFVLSELEKNKRVYPDATMVVDDKGTGVAVWELGDTGSGLIITDAKGIVKYFTRQTMSAEEMTAALELIRANLDS